MLERGFETLVPEIAALEMLEGLLAPVAGRERLALENADGRVLAEAPLAPRDVPHYDRCAMDGWAVRSEDTAGASASGPVRLRLASSAGPLLAVPVHTGSAVPQGADAVLPVEEAERDGARVDALRRLRPGEHVGRKGEDVRAGEPVGAAGHALAPADLGLLRALGIERILAVALPRVVVVATGEELVAPGQSPSPGQAVDGNGLMLAAACRRWGGAPRLRPAYTDDVDRLARAIAEGAEEADLVVTSGGTSVGERDQVVEALGRAGEVEFHGVAIQPARPVAAGRVGRVPVLCLPGFPAASYVAAFVFLRPAVARLAGRRPAESPVRRARLARKIVSTLGLRSYTRVRLEGALAEPVRTSGAGVLSSVTRAHGFVVTPESSEGAPEGAEVEVLLFE